MADLQKRQLNRRKFILGMAGLSLLSWRLQPAEAFKPFKPFSFAFVSDVHLSNDVPDSYELIHESQLFLQQLVKELNAEGVDFVMFGGDQVQTIGKDEANWNLFLDCLQPLNAAWSFVLGDRDVSGPIPVDKYKTYGRDWKLVGVQGENAYWSQNPKGVPDLHVIGLDTSLPNTTIGGMSRRQMEWLKQDLEANKQSFTIVFCHHPLLPPSPYDGGPPWDEYVIPDGGAVREILGQYPQVKMVISGHVHVSKVQLENNIWHISSPSLAVYPCAYRIFHVTPEAVTMETRSIDFPALVKKARKELINSSIAERFNAANPGSFVAVVEGDREDRDAIIPLHAGQPLRAYNPKKSKKTEDREPPSEAVDHSGRPGGGQQAQPAFAQAQGSAPTSTKKRRFGRHPNDAAAAVSQPAAGKRPSGDQADADKPLELESVKDVDAELDKQLHINSKDQKNGADSQ